MNKINEKIKEAIRNKSALSFGKLGGIESSHVYNYLVTGNPRLLGSTLFVNAGIYTSNEEDLKSWCNYYINAIKSLDYVLQWCPSQGDEALINAFWTGEERFYEFTDLEPYTHEDNGWHYFLSDKKVLFISPFSDTVKNQVPNYGKIWEGARIGEVLTVTSPYSEALTGKPPVSWLDKYRGITDEIEKLDFDFATVGCGGLSLLVCDFIKNMGKPCVHLGGGNQLLFGIRGKRWDDHEVLSHFCNDYWVRPLEHEVPVNHTLVEGGCYW